MVMFKAAAIALLLGSAPLVAQDHRERLPQDETIYFLLPDRFENGDPANDRGGLTGDRLVHGFDSSAKGFYHGGDLKGLIGRLDYIEALGATAIWLGPIYKNKPVQGGPGEESAGYHGYWITDFTRVDPHFGEDADMRAFVDAAHKRGMKVYLDIITNHTADVIAYRECLHSSCSYRSRADFPYTRRDGPEGRVINQGFLGESDRSANNFARLTDPTWAYTPYVPAAEGRVKVPAWLNDPLLYHNRGNSTFQGESSTMGDFVGLDDLLTENPRVVQGMIDIFGSWIDRYGIDGFRVDTARHVNTEFWQAFVPAMRARAALNGIPNFHIFGEVAYDDLEPGRLAPFTRVDGFPAVLDFAFRAAVIDVLARGRGTDQLARLFAGDALYEGGEAAALQLPTFIGNHDAGRFAYYVRAAMPQASDNDIMRRVILGHAMLFTLRGVPTIYSGDEQGFVGDGGDQDAREDMFASKVAVYNDNRLLGTNLTTAEPNFDRRHPIFQAISELAELRRDSPALRRGRQIVRNYAEKPGLFAVSRIDPDSGAETLVAFNTSDAPITVNIETDARTTGFRALEGSCPSRPAAPSSVRITIAALDYVVCQGR